MSLKQWYKARRLYFLATCFLLPLAILCAYIAGNHTDEQSSKFIVLIVILVGSFVCGMISLLHTFSLFMAIGELPARLGVDDVKQYIELSPSAMEDLCLRRLKVLGHAWDEAIKNHPMPFADERVKAESAFRRAYRFFVDTNCIQPTDWDPFFPQPNKTPK